MLDWLMTHPDILMFAAAIMMLMLGFPVAFTLAGVALAFAFMAGELGFFRIATLNFLPQRVWAVLNNTVIVAAPLFIFMGLLLERCKVAEGMLTAMAQLFGARPGGLLIATTLVGGLMAASTGIVGATVVTMGVLALPVMLRNGYDAATAAGAICAAGTLGQIIPPSIVLVFLGDFLTFANQQANLSMGNPSGRSVGVADLFAGSLLPGIFLVGLYIVWQLFIAWRDPAAVPALPPSEIRLDAVGNEIKAETKLELVIRALDRTAVADPCGFGFHPRGGRNTDRSLRFRCDWRTFSCGMDRFQKGATRSGSFGNQRHSDCCFAVFFRHASGPSVELSARKNCHLGGGFPDGDCRTWHYCKPCCDLPHRRIDGCDLSHGADYGDDFHSSHRCHTLYARLSRTGWRGNDQGIHVRASCRLDRCHAVYHGADVLSRLFSRLSRNHFHPRADPVPNPDRDGG